MRKEEVLRRVSKIQRRRLKKILRDRKEKQYNLAISLGYDPARFSKILSGWWAMPERFFKRIEKKVSKRIF